MYIPVPRPVAAKIVDVYVSAQFAKCDAIDKIKSRKSRKEQKKYDAMIAASQAKIGPYKPVAYVPEVWA